MVYSISPALPPIPYQRNRFSTVYALLEQAVADQVFPGCSFAVLAPGPSGLEVAALDAVGRQTYAVDSPKVTPGTIYDLASLTKVLATTVMTMLLYERGALQLDRSLVDILPGFASPQDANRSRVTLRHLLAHASGLAGYARLFETAHTPEALFEACLTMPLEHPPGEHAEYSDIGFILLGKALETIAGESIDSFCRREVFATCGMESVGFLPASSLHPLIPPTEDDTTFRHRIIQGEVQDENCWVLGGVSGHAGIFGNALDVLRFAAAVLHSVGDSSAIRLAKSMYQKKYSARIRTTYFPHAPTCRREARARSAGTPLRHLLTRIFHRRERCSALTLSVILAMRALLSGSISMRRSLLCC